MTDSTQHADSARIPVAHERLWFLLALVFVALSPVASYLSQRTDGGWAVFWFIAQVVATALAFGIPQLQQIAARQGEKTAADREVDVRVDTRATVAGALDPVLHQLASISVARDQVEREKLIEQVIPFVLEAAAKLIGSERSRSCWFELSDEQQPRLVPVLHAGRAGSPTTTFEPGTAAGAAAISMVLTGENRICEDIDAAPPPGWDASKQRDYKTFISVSVIAGDTAYGMLTLDALRVGDLNTDDLNLLGLMGSALAAALAQRRT